MTATEADAASNVWSVIVVMVLMGWLGGTINHFLIKEKGDEAATKSRYGRALAFGVGASLLIPLFLNTISSKLLAEALAENIVGQSTLVLAGFCLIAAISSRAFIATLADKVLKEAREAKEEASKAVQQVEEIAESVSEPAAPAEPAAVAAPAAQPARAAAAVAAASEEELHMLRTIESSKYTLRSTWGVAQDVGASPEETKQKLLALAQKGWLSLVEGKKGPRWTLTAAGRALIRA